MSLDLVSRYLEFVQNEYDRWHNNRKKLFFRGHANKDWVLLPFALRPDKKGILPKERELILDFKQVSVSEMDYRAKIENILVEMQHFGIPTRMLDWSLSPLVALYFACQACNDSQSGKESDGAVYALNPWEAYRRIVAKLNPHPELMDILKESRMLFAQNWKFDEIRKYIEKKYCYLIEKTILYAPVPFVGRYMVDRIASQRSGFILWGDGDDQSYDSGVYSPMDKYTEYYGCLSEKPFIIPGDHKKDILIFLRQLGVDSFSIFPDKTGIKKENDEVGSLFNYK